jgi:hypothetical protein
MRWILTTRSTELASPAPQIGPVGREVTIVDGRMWVLRGCSDAIDQAARMGPDGTLVRHQPGRNTRCLDWRALVGLNGTKRSGLLIRGFGVRVPGGAPVIKGSDLVILAGSEPFSCPVWTVGCSRGALEPLDETGPGWTRRTGIARSGGTGGPARAKVDRWNQGLMRRRANSRQSCAARIAAKWYGSDGPWVTSISGAWPSDEGRDRRSWRARRFLGAGWWV